MGRPRNTRPVSVKVYLSEYDGLWHGYITVGTRANGRPNQKHRTGATEEECTRKIRAIEEDLAANRKPRARHAPTVRDWITTWLTEIAPTGRRPLRPRTIDAYTSDCRNWIYPHLGGIRLDDLDTDHLDRMYRAMADAGMASSHLLKVHAIVRRALTLAVQRGKIPHNVAQRIDNPGSPKGRRKVSLTRDQAVALLDAIEHRPDALRWKLGLAIGPRQGEVLGLRWAHVDLDLGVVDLAWQIQRRTWRHGCTDPHACGSKPRPGKPAGMHRQARPACTRTGALHDRYHRRGCPDPVDACPSRCTAHAASCPQRKGGGLVFCRPKTFTDEDSAHLIQLPASLVPELRAHRAEQAAARLHAGSLWVDNDLIFCTATGTPIDPRRDWEAWQDVLAVAGLAGVGTHVMRRSAASILLELGEELAVVQEILGHTDIRTTRGYADVTVGLTGRAAKRMDAALFGGTTTDLATERERRRKA